MPRLLSNKSPKKISEVKVEKKKSEQKSEYEKRRVLEIEKSMSPSEYAKSRICGLENFVRKDYYMYEFGFNTRAEQEARIKYFMKGRERYDCLRLLRSTYK